MITGDDVAAAAARISGHARRTPAVALDGAFGLAHPLTLKLEALQHSGSFKARGAFNRLLDAAVPRAGVIAASGGNHGAAVAFVAQRLGLPATIFVPATAPAAKVERLRAYGAAVRQVGAAYADAKAAAERHARETGALDVPAYDDAAIVAGQGTVAREFADQARFDTLLVAVGGGGLIAGCAAALAGRVRVIGVETTGTATLHAALAAGAPVDVAVAGLAADSLGARRIGAVPWSVLKDTVDRVVLVEDDAVRAAQGALWSECRVIAEPGGAAALAALVAGAYRARPEERVGALVCGANVDLATVATGGSGR